MGQVNFAVQQTLKAGSAIAKMHPDNAIFHLTATTQPLPCGTDGLRPAFGSSRFVKATDGFLVTVLSGDQPLTVIPHAKFIPLDRFDETL
jgi:hypothetical protein